MPDPSHPEPAAAAAAAAAAAQGADASDDMTSAEPQVDVGKVVAGLQDEIALLNDKVLRAHAEMDNMRKRADREKADTAKYAITRFATDIVTVGDNLGRALAAVTADATEANPALKALVEGVTATDRALIAALERHGVKRLDPKGETFNPHVHQAIAQVSNPSVPDGTIIQVPQAGYMIEERVLRPAMVVVAQGGFKPVRTPTNDARPTPGEDSGGMGDGKTG